MKDLIMNPVAKKIAESVAGPISTSKYNCTVGVILQYFPATNTADMYTTISGTEHVFRGIPILMISSSVKLFLHVGDHVVVLFLFGDQDQPVIVGKIDEKYAVDTKTKIGNDFINF